MNGARRPCSPRICSATAAALALVAPGCLIDRSDLGASDAFVAPGVDASIDASVPPSPDAWAPPGIDAWAPDGFAPPDVFVPSDAFVPPPPDAFTPDAYVVPPPDAFVASDAFVGCVPAPEVCNGVDDSCDGAVDEGACVVALASGGTLVCESHRRDARTYLVCNASASWDLARAICRGFASRYDLVAFGDAAEQDAVRPWMMSASWMGLTDDPGRVSTATDGNYRWVDGTAPTYASWLAGEPFTSMVAGCVRLRTDGLWDAASCDDGGNRNAIVCEAAVP